MQNRGYWWSPVNKQKSQRGYRGKTAGSDASSVMTEAERAGMPFWLKCGISLGAAATSWFVLIHQFEQFGWLGVGGLVWISGLLFGGTVGIALPIKWWGDRRRMREALED